jgi:hypothetical protein
VLVYAVMALALSVLGVLSAGVLVGVVTIRDLLLENRQLKAAIANLTREDDIGYAKVLSQGVRDGRLLTVLKFVETEPGDKTRKVLEREYEIAGDVVHFDVLIVRFDSRLVMDGRERALYLWRRIYGENQSPAEGCVIEAPGQEPRRYGRLFEKLPLHARRLFWAEVWNLANDPERLRDLGVTAIYGNVVYSSLRPGLIYVFKISATGQLTPQVIPDL